MKIGIPLAHNKVANSRQKATGEALSAVLAEIVVRSSGDPLIELLTFFVRAQPSHQTHTLRLPRSPIERVSEPHWPPLLETQAQPFNSRGAAKQFSPALQRWGRPRKQG